MRKILKLFIVIFCLFVHEQALADMDVINVKAVDKGDYLRIFFYCQHPVDFSTSINGDDLRIDFSKSFSGSNMDTVFANLGKYVYAAGFNKEGNSIEFKLDSPNYRYRRFVGEKFVGIDIIKRSPVLLPETSVKQANLSNTPKQEKVAKKKVLSVVSAKPDMKLKRKFEQTAITQEVPADTLSNDVSIPTPDIVLQRTEQQAIPVPSQAEGVADKPVEAVKENKEINPSVIAKPDVEIPFLWNEDVASAVFLRGSYLWIVFDKFQEVDVSAIVAKNSNYFSQDSQQMNNQNFTIVRFGLKQSMQVIARKKEQDWVVDLTKENVQDRIEPKINITDSILQGSKIKIASTNELKTLRLIDPEVGDEMLIMPYAEDNVGFNIVRKYTDFIILPTVQGVSVQIVSDDIDFSPVRGGIEISGPTNKLAGSAQSALRELQEKEREARLRAEKLKQKGGELTLFKFSSWKLEGDADFNKDIDDLQWKITEVDWSKKSQPRLNLARFYFASALYPEALGAINIIKEYDEDFGKTNDVVLLEAASLYMMRRYREAIDVFDAVDKKSLNPSEVQEVEFWRGASGMQLEDQIRVDQFDSASSEKDKKGEEEVGDNEAENTKLMWDTSSRLLKIIRKMDPDFVNADEVQQLESTARFVTQHYYEAIKRFEETDLYKSGDTFETADNKLWWGTENSDKKDKYNLEFSKNIDTFLKYYPETVFNDFALLALEDKLKKNDLVASDEILSGIKDEKRLQQKDSIEFLRGLFYAKDEQDQKAIDTWNPLIENLDDGYNRMRSQVALTTFLLDKQKLTAKDAIENLNSVRYAWRGGVLEFQMLKMLGQFYMDEKQYMEGFKVWRSAISAFPGSDEALLIAKKMSDKFVQVFSQENVEGMNKLESLTLYYEFRELTPIGKLGDEMISKLADRLIDVDLLDRAAALLTHQVRFRLSGEERDQAAIKLVNVHLMNHKPQDALDVLNATENPGISPALVTERKYIKANCLIELGKSNMALSLLKGDESHQASFLRADVYWRNKVWRKVVEELETPFRDIRREEKQLNAQETEQLLRLSLAYSVTDQRKRLQILYEDFNEFISDANKKKVLTFIATDRGPVDYKNLEYSVELQNMDEFLKKYLYDLKASSSAEKVSG